MVTAAIDVPRAQIKDFCARHHIRKLALFGSVLRPDFSAGSDVDVLVEFEPGFVPGFHFIDMQDELSGIFDNRRVDLVTEKFLNRRIRATVLKDAVVLHEK